ncbi:MAG TPA: glycosyl hydrolase family 18 protein [Dehalococcoidia bacterium]|nr:glycosyl hydrolase family 18 protein [Dehalococcoidia bacterium]
MACRRFLTALIVLIVLGASLSGAAPPRPAAAAPPAADFEVPGGWFYTQANGRQGDAKWGYRITDEGGLRFWSEFQRLGGVPAVGYPVSQRFEGSGFILQATQKYIFQWRPDVDQVWFLNIFDLMHDVGLDGWLQTVRQVPPPESTDADAGLSWDQVMDRHWAMLDRNPAIKEMYWADPDPLSHFGLPMAYADMGNVLVLRAQRVVFQQWKQDMPWAKAGQITVANGGDVAKEAGLLPAEVIAPERSPQTGRIRWAYYTKWDPASWQSLQMAADTLDYVSPFYFSVDGQGNITGAPDAKADQFLRTKGIKILPTFKNGAEHAAFRPVLQDPVVRRRSIERIVQIVEENGYDGVNIDYEALSGEDRDALTAYHAELGAELRPRNKMITTAVGPKTSDSTSGWSGAYDYAALARYNDLIFIMAYAYRVPTSATAGSVGPVAWIDRVASYAVTRVPPEKLILGLAWYGYDWNLTDRSLTRSVRHADAVATANRLGAAIDYDTQEEVAYFRYQDGDHQREVWFEDARSLAVKTQVAARYGIAGIGGWRLGHEDPAVWSIFAAW